jgi:hypothetical protein
MGRDGDMTCRVTVLPHAVATQPAERASDSARQTPDLGIGLGAGRNLVRRRHKAYTTCPAVGRTLRVGVPELALDAADVQRRLLRVFPRAWANRGLSHESSSPTAGPLRTTGITDGEAPRSRKEELAAF